MVKFLQRNDILFTVILRISVLSLVSPLLLNCGGGGAGPPHDFSLLASIYYVDAANGDDSAGNGTESNAFKTITHAVTIAELDESGSIIIKPGIYDEALGEVFPIILSDSISLTGDSETRSDVVISGAGNYTSTAANDYQVSIVITGTSNISNLQVENSPDIGVMFDSAQPGASLNQTSIVGNSIGVFIESDGVPILSDNDIRTNGIGINVFGNTITFARGNQISSNGIGIHVGPISEINLGTKDAPGTNNIAGNIQCDLYSESSIDINAMGNSWDANEFTFTVAPLCSGGENIAATGDGTILYQFIPSVLTPLFPKASLINIIGPTFGQQIASNQPNISWNPTGQPLVQAMILDHPVIIRDRQLVNTNDIVWLWHSGLSSGNEGDIVFSQGVSINNGNINQTTDPVPLTIGRAYYWFVMAWNNDGTVITHSSHHNYFVIP